MELLDRPVRSMTEERRNNLTMDVPQLCSEDHLVVPLSGYSRASSDEIALYQEGLQRPSNTYLVFRVYRLQGIRLL